jgi:heme exporter protein D
MMPDLGKYATEVLAAYAVSLLLLAVLGLASWLHSRDVKRRLAEFERLERRDD